MYITGDLYTTAVLLLKGFDIQEVSSHGPEGRIKKFHFNDCPELQQVLMDYMNGKVEGNIRDFRNKVENVKDLIHN